MKNHPGKRLTIYDLPSIAKLALPLGSTPRNILAGFSCTGIWPFNREIFGDAEFAPSTVTDKPLTIVGEDLNENSSVAQRDLQTPTRDIVIEDIDEATSGNQKEIETTNDVHTREPSTSKERFCTPSTSERAKEGSLAHTPEVIRPYPKGDFQKSAKGRRAKGKTAVLTDTPEKQLLMEAQNKRKKLPVKRNLATEAKNKGKKQKIETNAKKKGKNQKTVYSSDSSEEEDDETLCLVCCGTYCNSNEDWLQCRECKKWAHISCTDKNPYFICNNCLSD